MQEHKSRAIFPTDEFNVDPTTSQILESEKFYSLNFSEWGSLQET